jgi:hypothetical protein
MTEPTDDEYKQGQTWEEENPDGYGGSGGVGGVGYAHGLAANRTERDEREATMHRLLVEAGQGMETGDIPDAWDAERHAEHVQERAIKIHVAIMEAFPGEDPENIAGPYGDGWDAIENAIGLLMESRDEARAETKHAIAARNECAARVRELEASYRDADRDAIEARASLDRALAAVIRLTYERDEARNIGDLLAESLSRLIMAITNGHGLDAAWVSADQLLARLDKS